MSDAGTEAACPICGGAAEAGCVYGRDGGWFGLQWRAGEPGVAGNFMTGLGVGDTVGEHGLFSGPFARGIRCLACRRIVLEI